jgi:hypothetical protein
VTVWAGAKTAGREHPDGSATTSTSSPWPSQDRRRPAKPHTPVQIRAGCPTASIEKGAAMFTLGLPVLIDGTQAGWITGIGTMARQGQVIWVDVDGRLRLFAGVALYRLERAPTTRPGYNQGSGGSSPVSTAVPVPPTAQGVPSGGTRAGPRQARAAGRTPAPSHHGSDALQGAADGWMDPAAPAPCPRRLAA